MARIDEEVTIGEAARVCRMGGVSLHLLVRVLHGDLEALDLLESLRVRYAEPA